MLSNDGRNVCVTFRVMFHTQFISTRSRHVPCVNNCQEKRGEKSHIGADLAVMDLPTVNTCSL